MSVTFDAVRAEVLSAVVGVVAASYPSTIFVPPNYAHVDLEKQEDPWVTVEMDMSTYPGGGIGDELEVIGDLWVSWVFRKNTGMNGSAEFTDTLASNLSNTRIGGISYGFMRVMRTDPFTGWRGTTHRIPFQTVRNSVCAA